MARTTKSREMEESFTNLSRFCTSDGNPMGKFGRLTVIDVFRDNGKLMAKCQCDCGFIKISRASHLVSGGVKSCGCLKKETTRANGIANTRHGNSSTLNRTATYRSWEAMKARCCNPSDPSFISYGGRGIRVDESWVHSFEKFLSDMGERPRDTTIDRIDNDSDYTPLNCRWAKPKMQQRNKRSNRLVLYKGERISLIVLAEKTGVPYQRLHERIVRRNWDIDDAINKTPRGYR